MARTVIVPMVLPKYWVMADKNGTSWLYSTVTGTSDTHTPPMSVGTASPGSTVASSRSNPAVSR